MLLLNKECRYEKPARDFSLPVHRDDLCVYLDQLCTPAGATFWLIKIRMSPILSAYECQTVIQRLGNLLACQGK